MISLSNSGFVFQYQFLNFSGLSWYFRKCYLTKERSAVNICFDATTDQLCTRPMCRWLAAFSASLLFKYIYIYVSFPYFCLHHWNKGKGEQFEKIISLREGCSWLIAVWLPPLLPPFETSTESVRRVGQDYLPRPCFCAFGAFGTWIEMVAGLGMILGATWQMGPHRQNATLYPLLFESGRVVNKVSSVSLL